MAQAALANTKPVDLGQDVSAVENAAEALSRAAAAYRIYPNFPSGQDAKAAYWREYQRCCAYLMEVVSHG